MMYWIKALVSTWLLCQGTLLWAAQIDDPAQLLTPQQRHQLVQLLMPATSDMTVQVLVLPRLWESSMPEKLHYYRRRRQQQYPHDQRPQLWLLVAVAERKMLLWSDKPELRQALVQPLLHHGQAQVSALLAQGLWQDALTFWAVTLNQWWEDQPVRRSVSPPGPAPTSAALFWTLGVMALGILWLGGPGSASRWLWLSAWYRARQQVTQSIARGGLRDRHGQGGGAAGGW